MMNSRAATTIMSHLDEVQRAFIAAVQDKGIIHALEWIEGWYSRAAKAQILDEYAQAKSEVVDADLTVKLAQAARSVTHLSSSAGHNMLALAKVEAIAELMEQREVTMRLESVRASVFQAASKSREVGGS